jgi:hypothetical protein
MQEKISATGNNTKKHQRIQSAVTTVGLLSS